MCLCSARQQTTDPGKRTFDRLEWRAIDWFSTCFWKLWNLTKINEIPRSWIGIRGRLERNGGFESLLLGPWPKQSHTAAWPQRLNAKSVRKALIQNSWPAPVTIYQLNAVLVSLNNFTIGLPGSTKFISGPSLSTFHLRMAFILRRLELSGWSTWTLYQGHYSWRTLPCQK